MTSDEKPEIDNPMDTSPKERKKKRYPHGLKNFGKNSYYKNKANINQYSLRGYEVDPIYTGGVQLNLDCRLELEKALINWENTNAILYYV